MTKKIDFPALYNWFGRIPGMGASLSELWVSLRRHFAIQEPFPFNFFIVVSLSSSIQVFEVSRLSLTACLDRDLSKRFVHTHIHTFSLSIFTYLNGKPSFSFRFGTQTSCFFKKGPQNCHSKIFPCLVFFSPISLAYVSRTKNCQHHHHRHSITSSLLCALVFTFLFFCLFKIFFLSPLRQRLFIVF